MTKISIKRIKRKIKGSRIFRWLKQLILWIKLLWHYVCVPFAWLKEFATVKHPKIWYNISRMLPGRLDRYIIGKFIGTYFFAILLIISISIVFDVNENLSKFTEYHAPLKAIVFGLCYYAGIAAKELTGKPLVVHVHARFLYIKFYPVF